LRALVQHEWGEADREDGSFPGGATLAAAGAGWVLAADEPSRALGKAMAWARPRGLDELHVLVSDGAGALARRAGEFRRPPTVWRMVGGELERAEPEPLAPPASLPPELEPYVDIVRDAGADPVVEHGVLVAEVLGLEVARISVGEFGVDLEVGVGTHDREAQKLIHGDRPPTDSLRDAVQAVRQRRVAGATSHPANQLAAERWLRTVVCADPSVVGARHLRPAPPPIRRGDLRLPSPAPAAGEDHDGGPVLVVCSTGIDLDLVPFAADARLLDGRDPRLVLVLPDGDDHPVTRDLAGALRRPADVVTVGREWRSRQ
jgi:hypothetical protein